MVPFKGLKDWEGGQPLMGRLSDKLRRGPALRDRINAAMYRLKVQQNRLEGAAMRMQQHDKDLFSKCVSAQSSKDHARASMYANECAEVRKMAKVTLQCQLALEQVTLRLETIEQFGDVAAMMGPVAGVVQAIKHQISGIMPEVSYELSEIGDALNGVVIEVGEATGSTYDASASSEEAQRILGEANAIAEQRVKEKFPDLPVSTPSPEHFAQGWTKQ